MFVNAPTLQEKFLVLKIVGKQGSIVLSWLSKKAVKTL